MMEISKKLQIPPDESIYLVNTPKEMKMNLPESRKETERAVLVFANDSKTLLRDCKVAVEAAKADRLSWIAYPKAGQLGTDMNRDELLRLMKPYGIQGVRLLSIDNVWSGHEIQTK